MPADERHREATAAYAAASAAYEAAAMSGDRAALAQADQRLRDADRAYGETAAALLAHADRRAPTDSRRRELSSFEEMLAHPWAQPDLDGAPLGVVVYSAAIAQSAGLPVHPGAGVAAPGNTPPASIASPAREAWRALFADTGDRPLVSH